MAPKVPTCHVRVMYPRAGWYNWPEEWQNKTPNNGLLMALHLWLAAQADSRAEHTECSVVLLGVVWTKPNGLLLCQGVCVSFHHLGASFIAYACSFTAVWRLRLCLGQCFFQLGMGEVSTPSRWVWAHALYQILSRAESFTATAQTCPGHDLL